MAYYNFTFGGQCGMGWWGSPTPAPYMADVYGTPVADFYVDAVPPQNPAPRVTSVTPTSIVFGWNPVSDQGDGSGADYVAVGMGGYTSWLSINHGPRIDVRTTTTPVQLATPATPADTVCAFVTAFDALGNTTLPQSVCGSPAGPPPVPSAPSPGAVAADPVPGLAGLPGWFWLRPSPAPLVTVETAGSVTYRVVAQPASADWSFGDGGALSGAGFGSAYPTPSSVQHAYDAESATGYSVGASVSYDLSWWWRSGSTWIGPYPLGTQVVSQAGLVYPVLQAQPELTVPG